MKAGYKGKDKMRENAQKLLGKEVKEMKKSCASYKEGGKVVEMKPKKMAMGGVAKIRHNVATKDGKPIRKNKKSVIC